MNICFCVFGWVTGKCLFLRSFTMIFQFSDKRAQWNLHSCKEFQNWFIILCFYSSVLLTRTFQWFVIIFHQTTNELITNIWYNTDLLFDFSTLDRQILLGSVKRQYILPWATKAIYFTWNSRLEFNWTICRNEARWVFVNASKCIDIPQWVTNRWNVYLNTLRAISWRQFQVHFLENFPEVFSKGPINNSSILVQMMTWCRQKAIIWINGGTDAYIVTRPQWIR